MKPCNAYQKRLWLDVYGELKPKEKYGLERHLSVCPECRGERDTLLNLIGRVSKTHSVSVLTTGEAARLSGTI
ncbi:MAG: zf-HC2 domain-containing protein, partial [Desulfococcus multivorans]|nr:zf-HC2 domain-containing protein [Desulfococcus multivorans]